MQQADILIIGGGITGTATACYLALSSHEVTLLEQSELAVEASRLNPGNIWATGWGHTPDLSSMLSIGHPLGSRPSATGEYATNLKAVASALS